MGTLKRKNATLPLPPPPSKKPSRDDHSAFPSANGFSGRRSAQIPAVAAAAAALPDAQSNGNSKFVGRADVASANDAKKADLPPDAMHNVENSSETTDKDAQCADDGKEQGGGNGCTETRNSRDMGPLVPNHAGWFSWDTIHELERRGLPEFFNAKSKLKTPTLYMEYRNLFMKQYLESPEKLLTLADVSTIITANGEAHREAARRIFQFLDHWGLINSRALVEPKGGTFTKPPLTTAWALQGSLIPSLYRFDSACVSSASRQCTISTKAAPSTTLPDTAIAELQGEPQGPAVDYHCNFCSADCSKRRFHCQKQADFDLCPECYNEGKFSFGMASTDFILMEALTEANDASSGGWTDQETLLLLEALELYGDNFSEIAEHVATKTKAQCILHFIRLPIEDPFLEGMESSNNLSNVQSVPDFTNGSKHVSLASHTDDQDGASKLQAMDNGCQKISEDEPSARLEERLVDDAVEDENSCVTNAITAAAQAAGLSGLDKSIAFSECGNPVMALAAFLAALVGPDVALTSAQSALKVLADQASALELADKNSFSLETECLRNDASDEPHGRALEEALHCESQRITRSKLTPSEDGNNCVDEGKQCPHSAARVAKSSSGKVKNAAATALGAAAVKAKFLADREEWEILHLAAGVVDSQIKKVEAKLRLFRELDMMLERERDQVEKSRQRLFAERAQIAATRAIHSASSAQLSSSNAAMFTASKLPHAITGVPSGCTPVSSTVTASPSGPNDYLRGVPVQHFKDSHGANILAVRPQSLPTTPHFANHSDFHRMAPGLSK